MKFNSKVRNLLVEEFILSLKQEMVPWHKPWSANMNAISNKEYSGINQVMLNIRAIQEGWKDTRWCTYHQAKEKGWNIKKGEKGTPIEFWSYFDTVQKKNLTINEVNSILKNHPERKNDIKMISKTYFVFNGKQIDNIPEIEKIVAKDDAELISDVKKVIKSLNISLLEQGTRAFYLPQKDTIVIPPIHSFHTAGGYITTLLHEMAHATGHSSRLNRDLSGGFGTPSYAKEELRAEIACSFLFAEFHTEFKVAKEIENHKAYVQGWISFLKESPHELLCAISDADKISTYIQELLPGKERDISVSKVLNERIEVAKNTLQKKSSNLQNDGKQEYER